MILVDRKQGPPAQAGAQVASRAQRIDAALAARAQAGPAHRRRRRWPQVLKFLRRLHLYFGLALLPWVLLYGLTALLFNHSEWLSSNQRQFLEREELASLVPAALPAADTVEARAFARLAAAAAEQGSRLERIEGSARWLGSMTVNGQVDGGSARASFDPAGRGGSLRLSPPAAPDSRPAWIPSERWKDFDALSPEQRTGAQELAASVAQARGLKFESAALRNLPEVRFHLREGPRVFACDIGLDGAIEVRPVEEVSTLRDRLLRLHVQHGDPGYSGAARAWFWIVDIMGVAMILWAFTGVVMWWGLRPTRIAGSVAIVAGISVMALAAWAVWAASGSL